MKKAPAAPAITTTPMIVKRYVPMPPVDGREESLLSLMSVSSVRGMLAEVSFLPSARIAVASVVFTE